MDLALEPKKTARRRKAVVAGVNRWRAAQRVAAVQDSDRPAAPQKPVPLTMEDVLQSMPRREIKSSSLTQVSLPPVASTSFKTSRILALKRLFLWLIMILSFFLGTFWDRIRRRDSEGRRAVRLRLTIERIGGTLIKFGQQLAMRIDMLPWAYTVELAKMLDQVPPFPLQQALEIIETSTGKPWQEIFSVFDPEPIGSASIANVYQAVLKNGDKVAVKVRRPGIGELFMADFKVFDWLLDFAEFTTIVRPGYTKNLRFEFQCTLLEELDFIQEARFQDMFRRNAKKSGKRFFNAPKIYFEFSSPEVIIQKFTSGIWLWEIMAAVEQGNKEALIRMRRLNIDPHKVAERLLWVNYWGMQENLIFHADPHPANVIVQRNSKLTFIDFGSCGSFNREQRAGLELTAIACGQNDPEGMARGTLKLFEPLPPLDAKALFQQAEAEYTRVLTIFKSSQDHTEWWERTSVRQWISFFKFSRENNIPVAIHTLRMIRATLLYDTVAVRIDKDVDRFEVYLKFREYREEQAKNRVTGKVKKQIRQGFDESVFLYLEDLSQTSEKLFYRTQTMLGSPMFNFSPLVGKWVYAASLGIRLVGQICLLTLISFIIMAALNLVQGLPFDPLQITQSILTSRIYQVAMIILMISNIRHILFRIRDEEV